MNRPSPSLEQYPGYYPPGSKPFWTRAKTASATGVGGLVLGLLIATGGSTTQAAPATRDAETVVEKAPTEGEIETLIEQAVDDATGELRADVEEARAETETAVEDAQETAAARQRKAVRTAVAKARKAEQAKTANAIAAAKQQAAAPAPNAFANTGGGTDPRFSYCYQAIDAGYGNYSRGTDPEYYWYDDNDGDGVVCE